MRLFLSFLFSSIFALGLSAQTSSSIGVWLDHLPYGHVQDMIERNKQVYCATEQGLFIYDHDEKNIERLSKANGLNDVNLSALGWSEKYQTLIIGYENGNVDLYSGGEIENMQDIRLSSNYSGLKKINHILTDGDFAYLCTDFGIVHYDLRRGIVQETFIIGPGGATLGVETACFTTDSIYAATPQGLFAASRNAPLLTFESWNKIEELGDKVAYVCSDNDRVFVYNPVQNEIFYHDKASWLPATQIQDLFKGSLRDMLVDKGYLITVNGFGAQAFKGDLSGAVVQNFQSAELGADFPALNTAVISSDESVFWIGSAGRGMVAWIRYGAGLSYSEIIVPNSPASRNVVQLYHDDQKLFVAPGGITAVWGPAFIDNGYYEQEDYNWVNHSSREYEGYMDVVAFVTDPADEDHYFASSYGNGILEFQNGQFVKLINASNSNLEPMANQTSIQHRIGDFATDPDGNIWFANSLTEKPLGVMRPDGSIENFSLGSIASTGTPIKNIMYTSNDQVWMQVRNGGIIVVQIVDGVPGERKRILKTEGLGNLPTETVLTFAEDLDGEVWVGTNEGMAILYSPQNIFEVERNFDFQILVIDEDGDGNGERVLGSEIINDIEVDGSNKKWFATANSGVYYTSESGKEQIHNFTVDNSPLPSNTILDIEIDDITGMVYFATDQGIVSFQGSATRGVENHIDVFAYPNPVEPGYEGPILIRGLVTNAQVKITDIEGNIVFETIAEGGQALWSGKSFSGERVKSGVYLAYITNDDGSATAVTKIMIIN